MDLLPFPTQFRQSELFQRVLELQARDERLFRRIFILFRDHDQFLDLGIVLLAEEVFHLGVPAFFQFLALLLDRILHVLGDILTFQCVFGVVHGTGDANRNHHFDGIPGICFDEIVTNDASLGDDIRQTNPLIAERIKVVSAEGNLE